MALSINTNAAAISVLKNINSTNNDMNKTMERLSTGFRINNASDDAAGFAISSKLSAQLSALGAAQQNATQASAMVKMADNGADEIQTMVERLKVLATTAASANNNTELAPLEAERVKLEGQITKMAQGLSYNGVKLLDGTGGVATFQVGATNNAYDQVTAAFNSAYDATTLGLGAAAGTIGTTAAGTFATQGDAQTYIATIDTALNTVITQRADLGATVNVLGHIDANISTSIEQLSASISSIRDADMAQESADLAKHQVLQQAQMAMLGQANSQAQNILSLFR